ncbi:penicillin acylase family protein [Gemmatimonas sp.]|uniref:penicillin acylase family protein n=1 Tax=Gemmatimonas sp. TaxID=1962908 RepID=UPI00398333EB
MWSGLSVRCVCRDRSRDTKAGAGRTRRRDDPVDELRHPAREIEPLRRTRLRLRVPSVPTAAIARAICSIARGFRLQRNAPTRHATARRAIVSTRARWLATIAISKLTRAISHVMQGRRWAMAAAAPRPTRKTDGTDAWYAFATDSDAPEGIGSNAVAMGKAVTASGRGLVLDHPHYPWQGSSRRRRDRGPQRAPTRCAT